MAFNKQQLVNEKDWRLLHPRLRGCQMWLSG